MEQLVLLLIIGAISLINWLIEQSGKRREMRKLEQERSRRETEESVYRHPEPVTPADETPRAQEIRRFLESFGVPLPEEIEAPAAQFEKPDVCIAPRPENPIPEFQPVRMRPQTAPPTKISQVRPVLGSAFLRQAVVWREVLGPPRSL